MNENKHYYPIKPEKNIWLALRVPLGLIILLFSSSDGYLTRQKVMHKHVTFMTSADSTYKEKIRHSVDNHFSYLLNKYKGDMGKIPLSEIDNDPLTDKLWQERCVYANRVLTKLYYYKAQGFNVEKPLKHFKIISEE